MVVNKAVGVHNLTVAQIQDMYLGRVTNWRDVGGPDLPIVLINRAPGSGTRNTFELRLLSEPQPNRPHVSCTAITDTPLAVGAHCDVPVTTDMLQAVAALPGAIGYSESSEAAKADVGTLDLDGVAATRDGAINRTYPFWGVEYAYTYGDLPGDSLATSFLRFLTDQAGKDVLSSHGNAPCGDLPDRPRCLPDS
jgi:phosphate transport system substrate-binding protein